MKHILVVDDNKTNLISAKAALGDIYKITAVTSGEQALKFLESNDCDLVLLDINMPEMDGFEVLKKIREQEKNSQLPVIFLTADNDAETESRCLEEGAMDYIAKPFVKLVIRSRIGRILELEDMRRRVAEQLEETKAEAKDFQRKSDQDALTGLWNRNYAREKINALVDEGVQGALFMMDLDNFKVINDIYGHIEGDNILKLLADTMRKHASENDVLCRIGGDEFLMFLCGQTLKKEISRIAVDIIADFSKIMEEKKYETNTSVSIGLAQIPEDGIDFDTVYNAADKALYLVKQHGKRSFHFYSEYSADEKARGNNLVDLNFLCDIISRSDTGSGAYQLELTGFNHVYNFIRRLIQRSSQDVQMVLFTAYAEEGVSQAEIDDALEMLKQAIYISLRRADVSTKYSNRQVIVILMDANTNNGNLVAKRIVESYKKICTNDRISISFDIAKIETGAKKKLPKPEEMHKEKRSILIVDDDKTNLFSAKNALGEFYKIIAVTNGQQALKFLESNTCDLILLDINMSDMDGFETMERIREIKSCSHIPIIFLTADNDPDTENKCLEAGAIDYLVKPFVAKILRARIGRTLELYDLRRNLLQKVEEKTESIEKLNNNIIKALSHTIDAKDRYTRGHSQRVADYSFEIARRLGKSEEEQQNIYYAGLLHDVGKIRVPEEIINKAGKLTDEEFEMIKLHPITSYHILKDISDDMIFSDGARFHHERYDGSGYPNGLAGEQIPDIARIVGVADAYDAMTSNRSYRQAMEQDYVRGEIEKGKGTQFDPKIADIMIRMIEEDKDYRMREISDNRKKILMVDSDPVNIRMVQEALKGQDIYDVKGLENDEHIIDTLQGEPFDILLLNVKMPIENGYKTAEMIRRYSSIPIVFMTSDKFVPNMEDFKTYNISDFITRPFKPAVLLEILHAVLAE